jgi:hypothetical protein
MHLPVSMVHSDLEEKLAYLQENNKLNLKREPCGWLHQPGAVSFVAKSTAPFQTKPIEPSAPRAVRKENYDEMLAKFNRQQQQEQQQPQPSPLESDMLISADDINALLARCDRQRQQQASAFGPSNMRTSIADINANSRFSN